MWEQKIKAVIMVANLIEGGRSKCAPYWPEGRGQTLATPLLTITKLSQVEDDAYDPTIITTVLEMEHRGTGEKRTMKHIQFKDWPDHVRPILEHPRCQPFISFFCRLTDIFIFYRLFLPLQGVPPTADKFLNLLEEVQRVHARQDAGAPYILVHCSAGIGRTGVLVQTLSMLDKLRHKVGARKPAMRCSGLFSSLHLFSRRRGSRAHRRVAPCT